MKAKLLKKLRKKGRNQIDILSVTTTRMWGHEITTGIKYSYQSDEYANLFHIGLTEDEVKNMACKIFLNNNMDYFRQKYRKYRKCINKLNIK